MKVIARDKSNLEHVEAARIATILLNQPEVEAQIDREVSEELARQLLYRLPPSSGLPDIRSHYRRYEIT